MEILDLLERTRQDVSKCSCSKSSFQQMLSSYIPIINVIQEYNVKKDLAAEIIAGITVAIMQIPQGNYKVQLQM